MKPGQLLGHRYRLDRRVDGGGMGDVWQGRDTRLDRTVAIKVLHSGLSGDATFRQRFHGEARAVAALQAPGVVNLYDYGEDTGEDAAVVSYLVMEFVEGRSLRHLLAEAGSLPADEVLDILSQAADALHAAHRAGIVHRDVKPGNILIKPGGQVKLVDFGIARAQGASQLTETGTIMGSVSYVSPEQLYGRELTGSSDVYSLGVVGYECLAGIKPFPGDVPATIITEQLHKAPPPLPDSVPGPVAEVVLKALEKDPAERWESAAAFAAACRRLRGGEEATAVVDLSTAATTVLPTARPAAAPEPDPEPTPVAPPRQPPHPRQRAGRGRIAVVAAVVVALLAVGGIAAARAWDDAPSGPGDTAADATTSAEDTGGAEDDERSSEPAVTTGASDPTPTATGSPTPTASDSASPSDDDSSSEEPTAPMPNLIGKTEQGARDALTGLGFTAIGVYPVGEGDTVCTVVEQSPEAGAEVPLDEEVSVGVRHVTDPDGCGDVSTDGAR